VCLFLWKLEQGGLLSPSPRPRRAAPLPPSPTTRASKGSLVFIRLSSSAHSSSGWRKGGKGPGKAANGHHPHALSMISPGQPLASPPNSLSIFSLSSLSYSHSLPSFSPLPHSLLSFLLHSSLLHPLSSLSFSIFLSSSPTLPHSALVQNSRPCPPSTSTTSTSRVSRSPARAPPAPLVGVILFFPLLLPLLFLQFIQPATLEGCSRKHFDPSISLPHNCDPWKLSLFRLTDRVWFQFSLAVLSNSFSPSFTSHRPLPPCCLR